LDIAANSIFSGGQYQIRETQGFLNQQNFIDYLQKLAKKHNIVTIEDPLVENDWVGWQQITKILTPGTLVVGDDLTTTNQERLSTAIEKETVTGVVVKPNQIGSLTEVISFALRAKEAGIKTVISHRGGETEDTFISDLAFALNADYIKVGSPLQKERYAKYARLIQIEKELWKKD
jgi:enolase